MHECIFCKIINRELPASIIYEDHHVIAFLDIAQTSPGHTLVVPKEHHDTFLGTPKKIMHYVMDVAQRIGQAQIKKLNARGVNVLINSYPEAGQTVAHYHVHVIPRYGKKDGLKIEMVEQLDNAKNLPILVIKIKSGL